VLLAAIGKLCMRQALWGKAQSYLEASVALAPTLDAHMTLARLMEQTGKRDEAIRHIRRSAELAR
jgi:HemY protein